MGKGKIYFFKCIQDSQEYGSDNEYMVSRVFFNVDINGKVKNNLYSDIKQTVGSKYSREFIEVRLPDGITGPFNYEDFANAARDYYLQMCGPNAKGIKIEGNCSNIRMRNNTFLIPYTAEFDIVNPGISW
jgi:hypothetical protein